MSQFLFKTIVVRTRSLGSVQNPNVRSLRVRWVSTSSDSEDDKEHIFVVSYLIDSLGFSPKNAFSASKLVKFDSPEKPDKAIEFLRKFGFSQTQISKLVRGFPAVLISTEKTILPKLEFLKAKGISEPEITKMLSPFPCFLQRSLSNHIIPSYDCLRNLCQSEERTINAIKRYPDILGGFNLNCVVSNADILLRHGVPGFKVAHWLEYQPRSFACRSDRFRDIVEEVAKMGFDASRTNFSITAQVSLGLSKSKWESKLAMHQKKFGFSEDEVSKMFRRNPQIMKYSEEKILANMSFFVNEMNWRPSVIALYPQVLGLSLKKRIIPRCSVYKALLSKGLVKKERSANPRTLLSTSEERFLDKYIIRYDKDAPELLELYEEKLKSLKRSGD